MHERIDGFQLTPSRRAVEGNHHARNGTRPEADADEVPGKKVKAVGDEVAEGARGAAYAREDGHLRGPYGHSS
jgi:hypothetical protein